MQLVILSRKANYVHVMKDLMQVAVLSLVFCFKIQETIKRQIHLWDRYRSGNLCYHIFRLMRWYRFFF